MLVTSSRINSISADADIFLNLVLSDGRAFSNALTHCGSLLTGMITIPNAAFQFQLEGSDSEGVRFRTNVDIVDLSIIGEITYICIIVCTCNKKYLTMYVFIYL